MNCRKNKIANIAIQIKLFVFSKLMIEASVGDEKESLVFSNNDGVFTQNNNNNKNVNKKCMFQMK